MRRLFLLIASVLCSTALAFGQGTAASAIPITINQAGAPIPSVLVTVCTTNPGTGACPVKVTTYTDITIGTACSGTLKALNNLSAPSVGSGCSNPGFSDGLGNVLVFAAAGASWCQFSGSGLTTYSQPCIFPFASVSNLAWQNITGPGPSIIPLQMGSSGSLSPTGSGQIVGTQNWLYGGMVDPVLTTASSGGSLAANNSISVQIAFNTALGLSLPSRIVSLATPAGCGTSCSATITAPTLPSWATSYTAYSCQIGACSPLQQTVSNNCVAITGNCVIQVVGTGAAPLTASTAFIQPPNLQASSCPPLVIPTMFIQDTNGNYQTQAGVDAFFDNTFGPPSPGGTLTFCRRVWFNDLGTSPPAGKNALVNIRHRFATGTSLGNQDRALSIVADNGVADVSTHYGLEALQAELDFQGTPDINGSPDGEVAAASFQLSDSHTGLNTNSGTLGIAAMRISTFRSAAGTYNACTYCLYGANIMVTNQVTSSFGGAYMVGLEMKMTDIGPSSNASSIGLHINTPGTRFVNFNRSIQIDSVGTNAKDFNIYSAGALTGGRNFFGGNVYLPNIITAAADIAVTGSLVASGSLGAAQFATPAFGNPSVAVSGTPGSTTWSYKITAVDGNGRESAVSAIGTTTTGNATLTGGNFNQIILSGPYVLGVGKYNVYRTAAGGTPSTTGKIGTLTVTTTAGPAQGLAQGDVFNDTGLAGDGTTPPTVNMTGSIQGANFNTLTNCAAAGTAANPSVASCTGAAAGSVSCATNASTGTCTVNTTAVTANSEILITQRTDTTTGTRLSVTCNTTIDTVQRAVTAVVAGTSFTFNLGTITTNPECFSYSIIN